MRFYNAQHQFYCGIDRHARTMYVCILTHAGEIVVHRHMPTRPDALLKTIAPYREQLALGVACLFTGDWLADLGAREGMPVVLGHALSRQAIHGGKAKNDNIDAQKIAGLLRGGLLPQAYVYPAERRATRDLLRRRHLTRRRAELLTPIQNTHRQSNLPEIGTTSASKATRDGVAERFAAPAGPKSREVDRALLAHYDRLLRAMALASLKTAKQHDANPLSLRRTVPGIGELLRLVLLYALHDLQRFPRLPDFVSSCRLVKGAKASAGKRDGTAGTKIGQASLTWAVSKAAGLCLRAHHAGQKSLTRLEKKHGKGTAFTVLAPKLARAVYSLVKRARAFDRETLLQQEAAERASPTPHWPYMGCAWRACAGSLLSASTHAKAYVGHVPRALGR